MYLQAEFVGFIPEQLEPGKIYISREYQTASHLCPCGCGNQVVTPLRMWQLTESSEGVSLHPSIGSFNLPCKSHYFITNGQVRWV